MTARKANAAGNMKNIVAAMIVGTVALMVLPAHPIVLGALVSEHRLHAEDVGRVATLEMLLLAFGAAVGPIWMRKGAMRFKVVLCLLGALGANLAMHMAQTATLIYAFRALAGVCEGIALSATVLLLMRAEHPDRMNGIFLGLSTVPQVVFALILPVLVVPQFGSIGAFIVLAALCGIGALGAVGMPDRMPAVEVRSQASPVWHRGAVLSLAAVVLQNAAVGGAWDHLQLLADQRHFSSVVVAIAMAGCLSMQVLGAFAVSAWGGRLGYRPALLIASFAQMVLIAALSIVESHALFVAAMLIFGVFWMAVSPFQVRLLIALDSSREAAQAQAPAMLAGLCLGPLLCSSVVQPTDVTGAFKFAAALMLVSGAIYGLAAKGRNS